MEWTDDFIRICCGRAGKRDGFSLLSLRLHAKGMRNESCAGGCVPLEMAGSGSSHGGTSRSSRGRSEAMIDLGPPRRHSSGGRLMVIYAGGLAGLVGWRSRWTVLGSRRAGVSGKRAVFSRRSRAGVQGNTTSMTDRSWVRRRRSGSGTGLGVRALANLPCGGDHVSVRAEVQAILEAAVCTDRKACSRCRFPGRLDGAGWTVRKRLPRVHSGRTSQRRRYRS